MTALEWLDAVRADLDAATPGPWEAGSFPDAPWDPAHSFVEIGGHEVRLDWLDGSALDARLIASAPDRLDRMERALRDVLVVADMIEEQAGECPGPDTARALNMAASDVRATILEALR